MNLIPRLHDTTGCQQGCQTHVEGTVTVRSTGLTTGCIHDTASCQTGCQMGSTTDLTTGCIV